MANKFQIDSHIPYPGKTTRAGRPRKVEYEFPMPDLDIGQSFFVPSKHTNFSAEKVLRREFERARREFSFNLVWTQEPGGFRIYRIDGEARVRNYHQRRRGRRDQD